MLRYKQVKGKLKEEIAKRKPNDRLPARPELCLRFDTTRTTLDKAIAELVEEGYLISKFGSGTYIAGMAENEMKQAGSWGVIVPNIMDSIYPGLVRGIENVAQGYGASITLCNSDNDAHKQEQYIRRLRQSGISGFVIVPVIHTDHQESLRLYSQLTAANIPFVFCNRSIDGIDAPVVTSNSFFGGYLATMHLIAKGYRRIGFVAKIKYRTSMERCQGYMTALLESGMEIDRDLIFMECQDSGRRPAYWEARGMMRGSRPIDAVFCFNDSLAAGVYEAAKEEGLRISADVGVIGYDNADPCETAVPKLTSVSYKSMEIGGKAAELLWKLVNNQPLSQFPYYLYEPEIIQRESCLGPNPGHAE